jgi:hypothetical protein
MRIVFLILIAMDCLDRRGDLLCTAAGMKRELCYQYPTKDQAINVYYQAVPTRMIENPSCRKSIGPIKENDKQNGSHRMGL